MVVVGRGFDSYLRNRIDGHVCRGARSQIVVDIEWEAYYS